jgi:hypothetical protein
MRGNACSTPSGSRAKKPLPQSGGWRNARCAQQSTSHALRRSDGCVPPGRRKQKPLQELRRMLRAEQPKKPSAGGRKRSSAAWWRRTADVAASRR